MLKQRFKWVAVLWWILFIMIVLGAFALVSWNMWDTWKLREESMTYGARVERRIDETAVNSQRNLQDRSLTVEQRPR
jgi:predicted negative regulator of RcsB-dependent stress response